MKFFVLILLMSLAGWVTAQQDQDGHCDEHNSAECGNSNCILLKGQVPNCCEYKKKYSRSVDGRQYILLNPCEEILLYKHVVKESKWTTYSYYFSKDLESPVLKLTKENLKKSYKDDVDFNKKLDEVFTNDRQLAGFDTLYNMYVVNWLYTWVKKEPRDD